MKVFEQNIIKELLRDSEFCDLDFSLNKSEVIEFSGAGYFLTIQNHSLPEKRIVLNTPNVTGKLGGIEVGYLVFIENSELMLECHSYDKEILPKYRDQGFVQHST